MGGSLEGPGGAPGRPWKRLENLWSLQVLMGRSWKPLGTLSEPKTIVLERLLVGPKTNFKTGCSHLGGERAPEREPKRVQNRAQEVARAENTISSKTIVF